MGTKDYPDLPHGLTLEAFEPEPGFYLITSRRACVLTNLTHHGLSTYVARHTDRWGEDYFSEQVGRVAVTTLDLENGTRLVLATVETFMGDRVVAVVAPDEGRKAQRAVKAIRDEALRRTARARLVEERKGGAK